MILKTKKFLDNTKILSNGNISDTIILNFINRKEIPVIFIALFILFTAMSNIVLHFLGHNIPHMLLIFLSTSYAIIFFNVINYNRIGSIYKKLSGKKTEYFLLLLFLLGIWFGAFLIPIYFLPSIYLFTFMAIGGSIGATLLFLKDKTKSHFLRALLMIVNIVFFYFVSRNYYSGSQYIILIVATVTTAISGYGYLKMSQVFNQHNFSTSQVLAIRFWLLWILSLALVIYNNQFSFLSLKILLETMFISSFYLIIPVYCSQKAIENIGPEKTSLGLGFTPIVTFFFEKTFLKNSFNFTGYFSLILALILLIFYFIDNRSTFSKFSSNHAS